jgi:tRNA threonylcarbamoyladenosine biosynthesis protein TsaB
MLLAVDTATRNAGVALYTADGIQAEITWRSRENHTVELTPQIVHLLELGKTAKKDLKAIGVALGPGSFTGLRVGMSVAKGLAFALSIPIMGIPTLDAIAYAQVSQPLPIFAVLAAGRGRYSVARYAAKDEAAVRVGDYALLNADGVVEYAARESHGSASNVLFCGEIDAALAISIKNCLGASALKAPLAQNMQRVGLLAELAWGRFQRGESDDTASLAPIYAVANL